MLSYTLFLWACRDKNQVVVHLVWFTWQRKWVHQNDEALTSWVNPTSICLSVVLSNKRSWCYGIYRPTYKFPHPLSRVKPPAAYRVSVVLWFGWTSTSSHSSLWLLTILRLMHNSHVSLEASVLTLLSSSHQMSYGVVDTLIWLGIRGIINSWRKKNLKLRPINYLSGVSQGSITEKPTGYIWSPHLVPKPKG